jgi:hypothetical protein
MESLSGCFWPMNETNFPLEKGILQRKNLNISRIELIGPQWNKLENFMKINSKI